MEWQDEGVILEVRPFGERAFLVQILTKSHGRHLGLWKGTSKGVSSFQIGMCVAAAWKARLESQLGLWALETTPSPHFLMILEQKLPLLGLVTLNALCRKSLPERQSYPLVYQAYRDALTQLAKASSFATALIFFELTLLKELGYGLCLKVCVVTGAQTQLTHVSPVSGKAVCARVADPYKGRLLPLPAFLGQEPGFDKTPLDQLQQAFSLTGFFLKKHVFDKTPGGIPQARENFLTRFYQAQL